MRVQKVESQMLLQSAKNGIKRQKWLLRCLFRFPGFLQPDSAYPFPSIDAMAGLLSSLCSMPLYGDRARIIK